jgi:hypothetical protein
MATEERAESASWPHWALDLPGLTQPNAEKLIEVAESLGVAASAVDPADWLTLHCDRSTALTLARALGAAGDEAHSVRDIVQEWLDATR